jgi:hypothetical protein
MAKPGPEIADRMRFRFEPNDLGFKALELDCCREKCVLHVTDARGVHQVTMGLNAWIHGETSLSGAQFHHGYEWDKARVVASAHWVDPQTVKMEWVFAETSFRDTVICRFENGRVFVDRRVNVNSGRHDSPRMIGLRIY